jgi:hypothetical protein
MAVVKTGRQMGDLHVRVTKEELSTLQEMAAIRQVPTTTVVRAMIRHFVIEWRAGREVVTQLGAVVWRE